MEPNILTSAFNCPICNVYAQQNWFALAGKMLPPQVSQNKSDLKRTLLEARKGHISGPNNEPVYAAAGAFMSVCAHCREFSLWHGATLVYPTSVNISKPNSDLPDDIKADFNEAAAIAAQSPRGAAAILRLCIQKLCIHLGEKGRNIDEDIAGLVKKGLPGTLQMAMDTLRVTGNESVHPGEMDIRDDIEMATGLFDLINIVAEQLITEPKKVKELYSRLPKRKLEAITRRDDVGNK